MIASTALAVLTAIGFGAITVNAQDAALTDSSGGSAAAARSTSDENPWKGWYAGVYGGGAANRSGVTTSTVFSQTGYFAASSVTAVNGQGSQKAKPTGFSGGGTFGYNHQTGSLVVGAEIDFGAMNASDSVASGTTYPCCGTSRFTINQSTKTRWLLTARPRLGAAIGKSLIYGTGGLAVTDVSYSATFTDTLSAATESGSFKKNKAGWTIGAGAEFKLGQNWSVKGEYLYADLGSTSITSTNLNATPIDTLSRTAIAPNAPFPTNVFTHSSDLRTNNFRFGVNFHF